MDSFFSATDFQKGVAGREKNSHNNNLLKCVSMEELVTR